MADLPNISTKIEYFKILTLETNFAYFGNLHSQSLWICNCKYFFSLTKPIWIIPSDSIDLSQSLPKACTVTSCLPLQMYEPGGFNDFKVASIISYGVQWPTCSSQKYFSTNTHEDSAVLKTVRQCTVLRKLLLALDFKVQARAIILFLAIICTSYESSSINVWLVY